MRREALEVFAREAAVAHERTRREAEELVAQRAALAAVVESARRQAADERLRREAFEAVARRAAEGEARARREAERERAQHEAWLEAEAARERREAATEAARVAADPQPAEPLDVEKTSDWIAYRIDDELTSRLVQALTRLRASSDATATRLERLTWALVGLGVVIGVLALAVFLKM